MKLGFSEAKFSVVKRGPMEVREQGLLADHIGSTVCPQIYRHLDDGYEMELLSPPTFRSFSALIGVFGILNNQVWPRRPYKDSTVGWLQPLKRWVSANDYEWLLPVIDAVYPEEPTDGYCLIHGDPTLANLMMRGSQLIITDPMPRMDYRIEIPNRMEVDTGKLLQSAVGWERVLGCGESTMWEQPDAVLGNLPAHMVPKTLLWGSIHLARVGRRALGKKKLSIANWALNNARRLARNI